MITFTPDTLMEIRADYEARMKELKQIPEQAVLDALEAFAFMLSGEPTEDSQEVKPDNDGWIPWNGGTCPVPGETKVSVKFRDGTIDSEYLARGWNWAYLGRGHDREIVAYKVIEETKSFDEWIPWNGGTCPVAPDTLVKIQFRNGGISDAEPADSWYWGHEESMPSSAHIIAYKIVKK